MPISFYILSNSMASALLFSSGRMTQWYVVLCLKASSQAG
jgi:hypothetical protein